MALTQEEIAKQNYDKYLDFKFEEWYKTLPYRSTNTTSMKESFKAGWEEATRLSMVKNCLNCEYFIAEESACEYDPDITIETVHSAEYCLGHDIWQRNMDDLIR